MEVTGFSTVHDGVRTLALIVPELSNPYFAQMTQALTDAAHHRGLEIAVFVTDGREARERAIVARCAGSNGVGMDAAVFVSMTGCSAVLAEVPVDFPFVVLDERLDGPIAERRPFVGADNFGGAYQAATFLLSRGHRRIAHIAGPGALGSARERLRGFLQVLRDAGLEHDPALLLEGPYSESFGASVLPRILRQDDPPTTIFAASDIVAVGMTAAAPMHGVRIPEEISLIGFDGIEQGTWAPPPG